MTIDQLGGASGDGLMEQTLAGKALADDGNIYDTVQAAENAASSLVVVGPGTFSESVTIDTPGLRLVGSGYNTLIDGGTTGHAIEINAENVTVSNISAQTTSGSGNDYNGIHNPSATPGNGMTIVGVVIRQSDGSGINSRHSDSIIRNSIVHHVDNIGIRVSTRSVAAGNILYQTDLSESTSAAIRANRQDNIVSNNNIYDHIKGIQSRNSDQIVIGNRIHNSRVSDSFYNGIDFDGATNDSIMANNRISDSGDQDIRDAGTGNVLDANVTGAAN